ncbi:transcriptional regulatory protein YehT [Kordia sp. SMS9]|uniref:LytR/AlgR family response regulator transcription factor n=1 Tax=Kordia sp. SMS9 TaxID=2282170 RepID=UPI000E0DADE6|nr:LytTR family DNA-binding domain-containing protein [Kordia sp. SMS9]AXG68848.1 transcriptional regulatory protein YehT [Kordia sp. SMS9]
MIDVLVIEDEIEIQNFIVSLLSTYCKDLQIVGTSSSVAEATSLIKIKKPELIFLDVELKDGKAFDLLNCFDVNDFVTIFLTGYSKYGINAVKYGVSDYLLKPIILKELIESVEKAKAKVKEKHMLRKFYTDATIEEVSGKILVQKINKLKVLLNYAEILNWTSEEGFTRVYLNDNQSFLLNGTLKSFYDKLPSFFIKIHRSHAVNLHFVQSYGMNRNGWVKLNNGTILPVSSRNKRAFLAAINAFSD